MKVTVRKGFRYPQRGQVAPGFDIRGILPHGENLIKGHSNGDCAQSCRSGDSPKRYM